VPVCLLSHRSLLFGDDEPKTLSYAISLNGPIGADGTHFKGFDALIDDDLPSAKVFLADRGYDSDHIRKTITNRGGTRVIPGKANRKIPIHVDAITYALRNRVERCFNKLKCSRRLATRYDKTAASYLGFIHIAAARIWVRSLST
jgi:transposase